VANVSQTPPSPIFGKPGWPCHRAFVVLECSRNTPLFIDGGNFQKVGPLLACVALRIVAKHGSDRGTLRADWSGGISAVGLGGFCHGGAAMATAQSHASPTPV